MMFDILAKGNFDVIVIFHKVILNSNFVSEI